MILSQKQAFLLSLAREKGFVTLGEASLVYDSGVSRRGALQKLVQLGFLRPGRVPNRFDLVGGVS